MKIGFITEKKGLWGHKLIGIVFGETKEALRDTAIAYLDHTSDNYEPTNIAITLINYDVAKDVLMGRGCSKIQLVEPGE